MKAIITEHTLAAFMGRGKEFSITLEGKRLPGVYRTAKHAESVARRKGATEIEWVTK